MTCEVGCECFRSKAGIRVFCENYKGKKLPEFRPNITELTLKGGNIPKLYRNDLSKYFQLRTFILKNIGLKLIQGGSFDSLRNLTLLSIIANEVFVIPLKLFAYCGKLQRLQISENYLQYIHNESFTGLEDSVEILDLSNNRIAWIRNGSFGGLLKLQVLKLSGNLIRFISENTFGNIPNLLFLFVDNNIIETIKENSIRRFHRLTKLDLNGNKLKELPVNLFEGSKLLKQLDLSNNELTDVPIVTLRQASLLQMLKLDSNKFKRIRKNSFAGLQNLDTCSISFNNYLFFIDEGAFYGMQKLSFLKMTNNPHLTIFNAEAFSNISSLTKIELDFNNMTNLDERLFTIPNLVHASISWNPVNCNCKSRWIRSAMEHPEIYPFIRGETCSSETFICVPHWKNVYCYRPIDRSQDKLQTIPEEEFTCSLPEIIYTKMELSLGEYSYLEVNI